MKVFSILRRCGIMFLTFIIICMIIILGNQFIFDGPFCSMIVSVENGHMEVTQVDPCVFDIGYMCLPDQKWKFHPTTKWGSWSHQKIVK